MHEQEHSVPSNNCTLSQGLDSGTPLPLPGRNLVSFLRGQCSATRWLFFIFHYFLHHQELVREWWGPMSPLQSLVGRAHPLQKKWAISVVVQGHTEELGPGVGPGWPCPVFLFIWCREPCWLPLSHVLRLFHILEDCSTLWKHDSRVTWKRWFQNCYLTC